MQAPASVIDLVKKFERNLHAYKSGTYNETQVRVEFINPFFEALGWDVYNKSGCSEQYKDVIHEFSLKTQEYSNAPDYLFKVGTMKKFFVEAKKPVIYIKEDIHPAYQLRRYAWSAKLPLSILTDFEEFAVYDCRLKPNQKDKASVARRLYYTFREYPDMWGEIHSKFSKEAVLQGEYDKFAEGGTRVKGTEVDDAFLQEIEGWRDSLARNIALRNPRLSGGELNYSVQKIIDRIIFLRICEGRGIEEFKELHNLSGKNDIYKHLISLFKNADKKYNSGLFHFTKEKDITEDIDNITPALSIDDKIFKDIIESLYYPKSPYEFSVFGAEILGHVYEQFLGKVIRLTAGHQAKVEEKPEVKKAGGVYYTPAYIVDYIVKNTLGKKLEEIEGRSEGKVKKMIEEAGKLRVLDPACGSGSFLLGAYQYLLDWHIKIYQSHEKEFKERVYRSGKEMDTDLHLTTKEKKRILLNNIYGVDIDSQAVEVSKLSLLLKVLEGETDETLAKQLDIFTERALPDLSKNIKCGNSLIDTDYYDNETLFEQETSVNPFNWQKGFPDIFAKGGFDVVIGNPPYVRIQTIDKIFADYFKNKYISAKYGNYDMYILFIEKAIYLIKEYGMYGMILPNKFFQAEYGEAIRSLVSGSAYVNQINDFTTNQIFNNATTYTCLLFLSKQTNNTFRYCKYELGTNIRSLLNDSSFLDYDSAKLKGKWNIHNKSKEIVLDKLRKNKSSLRDICKKIFKGSSTGDDEVYLLDLIKMGSQTSLVYSKALDEEFNVETAILKQFIYGKDVRKFSVNKSNKYLLFPYKSSDNFSLLDIAELQNKYPLAKIYLDRVKGKLIKRKIRVGPRDFYKYSAGRSLSEYNNPKILIPDMLIENRIAIDFKGEYYHGPAIHGIILKNDNDMINLNYVAALISSKLFWFFIKNTSTALRGNAYRLTPEYIDKFPVKVIDKTNSTEIHYHTELVTLIDRIFILNGNLVILKHESDRKQFQTKIDYCEDRINKIVYELYGLTEEEIKIVEGKENN